MLRSAIGTQQVPPTQVIIGLSLVLTFFIMSPVWDQVNREAVQPYLEGKVTQQTALDVGQKPVREFMLRQTRPKDIALFVQLSKQPQPKTPNDISTATLLPAFVISELKTAFQMAFVIFVPFLVIDLIVSSALLSMGMMMLPPSLVSLPFKILLFVMADGWYLIVKSLITSFIKFQISNFKFQISKTQKPKKPKKPNFQSLISNLQRLLVYLFTCPPPTSHDRSLRPHPFTKCVAPHSDGGGTAVVSQPARWHCD